MIDEVSNLTTGHCPEPESWTAVGEALDRIEVLHPGRFTPEIVFRRCPRCGERNVVKDGWLDCQVCGGGLPESWNLDDRAPNARRRTPERGRIRDRSLTSPTGTAFGVLIFHDGPRDAVRLGAGGEGPGAMISLARPAFAFFGRHGSRFGRVEVPGVATQVFHLAGLEMRRGGSCAEAGRVGLLTWQVGSGTFEFLDEGWLGGFTRHNWWHPRPDGEGR